MLKTHDFQSIIDDGIHQLTFPKTPANLYDPLRYFLKLGGKRTRPTLTLLACELFGKDPLLAKDAALAIEVFHNFTLIHDDIMDKAPLRRGKETVHEKWNSNVGILSGDVLFVEAYKLLGKYDAYLLPKLYTLFSQTAIEVCEGQQLDMDFEDRNDVTIAEYIEMIRLKTSVLLGTALELGAVIAEADDQAAKMLYDFGVNIGIAFQLQDDYLDLYADPDKFGKQVGGDVIANKKTFLLLKAFELASKEQKESLDNMLTKKSPSEKVQMAQQLFQEIGAKEVLKQTMKDFYDEAMNSLDQIPVAIESKKNLIALANFIMNREH